MTEQLNKCCNDITDIVSWLKNTLKNKSIVEWRHPMDQLPCVGEVVFVYFTEHYGDEKHNEYIVGMWDENKTFVTYGGSIIHLKDVIAWCYLPEYKGEMEK